MSEDAKYFVFLRSELENCRVKNDLTAYNLYWRLRAMSQHFISGGLLPFARWCL